MTFLFRAVFWLAIVSCFVPREFAGDPSMLPVGTEGAMADAGEALEGWCEDRPAVCEAGEEAARLGGFLADFATDRIEDALEEHAS
jgi:hypothetical protein